MLEQVKTNYSLNYQQHDGQEYDKSHIPNLIAGIVADLWRAPLAAGIHDQPHEIEDDADGDQAQGESDINLIEEVHKVNAQQASNYNQLNYVGFYVEEIVFSIDHDQLKKSKAQC